MIILAVFQYLVSRIFEQKWTIQFMKHNNKKRTIIGLMTKTYNKHSKKYNNVEIKIKSTTDKLKPQKATIGKEQMKI